MIDDIMHGTGRNPLWRDVWHWIIFTKDPRIRRRKLQVVLIIGS